MDRIQLVSTAAAVLLLFVVLEMVRRRRLLERYALLWLLAATVVLALAVWRGALVKLAHVVGIVEPPNALFFIALAFILLLLLHFSSALSRLSDQSKVLAQRVALLDTRLRALQAATDGTDEDEPIAVTLGELEQTRS
ncbi:MAG: DUF2304 domain-containing protein [Actinobacteria bacterium]|nr:DUF2304 domain-containing protein [Actinomycetota bacterium]